jgi:hypothetical protein
MRILEAGVAGRALAVAVAAAVVACGGLPRQAPVGTATVAKVERAAWNAQPETGLFRVTFDEERTARILARASYAQAPEGVDPYFSERDGIEEEASRELREKGLCGSSVQLVSPVERSASRGITAIFKCRPTVF